MKTLPTKINTVNTLKVFATIIFFLPLAFTAIAQTKTKLDSGHVKVNGISLYYETFGKGRPLVLLHGAFMNTSSAFGALIPELSKTHRVIAVDLQGHGRTADNDRPFSFETMADDVAALLKHLKTDSADVLGYSMGGGVAQQIAIRHPELVRKLVIISSVYKFEGWKEETRAVFPHISAEGFENTPMKWTYDSLAPDPKHWTEFMSKMKTFVNISYDFGADKIKAIKAPALIILGDADGVTLEHAADMYYLFGGGRMGDMAGVPDSQLAIYPATTHWGAISHTNWLLDMIQPYLDAPKTEK